VPRKPWPTTLTALRDVQQAFRCALLDEDDAALALLIEGGPARLGVHRNNLFASLSEVLRDTFPAVCRLVDERFFAYAAHEFIRGHPPTRAVLAEYGEGFAEFLVEFPPLRDFPYLADVARLEWLMARAAIAADAAPIAVAALADIAPDATPRLLLRLQPSFGFLASPWPVDAIWRANRRDAPDTSAVDLGTGSVRLEVSRSDADVVMRAHGAASFAFRCALANGGTLEAAAAAALAADPQFDLGGALGGLFHRGAVIDVALAPSGEATAR
jgi:hypothetical protein